MSDDTASSSSGEGCFTLLIAVILVLFFFFTIPKLFKELEWFKETAGSIDQSLKQIAKKVE